jgi:hypothetical protein
MCKEIFVMTREGHTVIFCVELMENKFLYPAPKGKTQNLFQLCFRNSTELTVLVSGVRTDKLPRLRPQVPPEKEMSL